MENNKLLKYIAFTVLLAIGTFAYLYFGQSPQEVVENKEASKVEKPEVKVIDTPRQEEPKPVIQIFQPSIKEPTVADKKPNNNAGKITDNRFSFTKNSIALNGETFINVHDQYATGDTGRSSGAVAFKSAKLSHNEKYLGVEVLSTNGDEWVGIYDISTGELKQTYRSTAVITSYSWNKNKPILLIESVGQSSYPTVSILSPKDILILNSLFKRTKVAPIGVFNPKWTDSGESIIFNKLDDLKYSEEPYEHRPYTTYSYSLSSKEIQEIRW